MNGMTAGTRKPPFGEAIKHDVLAIFLLAVMAVGYHHRAVFFSEVPRWKDVSVMFEPMRAYYVRALRAGHVPIWCPDFGLGVPIMAESESAIFHPLNLLVFSLAPFREGALVLWVVRAFLASVGAYALARSLGASPAGALLAGLVFMLNGFVVAHQWVLPTHWSWVEAPFLILAAERLVTGRRAGTVLWGSLVFGLAFLMGHYQLQWISMVLYAIYGAVRIVQVGGGWRPSIGRVIRLGMPIIIGAALAAAQLVPSAELKPLSPRAGEGVHHIVGGTPPLHLVMYLFPYLFEVGDPIWEPFRTSYVETLAYVGVLPLFLVPLAWRRRRDIPAVTALVVGAGLLTLLSFGRWFPAHSFLVTLPGFGYFADPGRYAFGVALCLGVLAGIGLDARPGPAPSGTGRLIKRRVMWVAATALVAVVGMAAEWEWAREPHRPTDIPETLRVMVERGVRSLPVIGVSLLALGAVCTRWRGASWLAVAVAAADLTMHGLLFRGPAVARPSPAEALAQPGAILRDFASRGITPNSPWRHAGGPHGGREVAGYRSLWFYLVFWPERCTWVYQLNLRPFAEVAHLFRAFHVGYLLAHEEIDDDRLELLYVGDDEQVRLFYGPRATRWYSYRLVSPLPRAYLVDQAVWLSPGEEVRRRVEEVTFDAAALVVLEGIPPEVPDSPAVADHTPPGSATVIHEQERLVRLQVEAERPAWLVLTDLYYPGWKAFVDGVETSVYQANYVCRAVRVPAGRSVVEFAYEPASLFWGLRISLATLASIVAASIVLAVRRARTRSAAEAVSRSP